MRRKTVVIISLLLVLALGLGGIARAQDSTPTGGEAAMGTAFTYQGQLQGASGPVTGNCDFQFGLWDALTGGAQIGTTQTKTNEALNNGLFTVTLDFGMSAFAGSARWLGIAVSCPTGSGSYTTLTPRQALTPTPYANYAPNAGNAATANSASSAPWSGLTGVPAGFADGVDDNTTYNNGNGLFLTGTTFSVNFYGSGSATTVARSDHTHWGQSWSGSGTGLALSGGTIGLSGSGSTYGVYGTSSSTSGFGVYGQASATTGVTYGVWGASQSDNGRGVIGYVNVTTGMTYGVIGQVSSISGTGVFGTATATTGSTYGVWGTADSTSGKGVYGTAFATTGSTYGVYGLSYSTSGTGVYGRANATDGITKGVSGVSASTSGTGVYGSASATTGLTYGVVGLSSSTDGVGVYGSSSAMTGTTYGVYGYSDSTDGVGVKGYSAASSGETFGVIGTAISSTGVGVLGRNNYGAGFGVVGYTSSTTGTAVYGHAVSTTGGSCGVWGQTDSPAGWGVYGQASCNSCNFGVFSNGNLYVTGSSTALGSKSAIVQTQDYGWVNLYSMESPRVLFEDVNTAQLVNGKAVVTIDPVFAQTIDLTQPYQVFLTPGGDCNLYVSNKTPTAFTVFAQGGQTCSISFDYRIIAVRKGYTGTRLQSAEDPALVTQKVQLDSGATGNPAGGIP